jgi:ankyrin repeat protein
VQLLVAYAIAMDLHRFLDLEYKGDDALRALLPSGADPNARAGELDETLLHVATRRRRASACQILVDNGADPNAKNGGGKTACVHALRRGFDDVVAVLAPHTRIELTDADRLAIALVAGRLDEARAILAANPSAARTGNPEEDRLIADLGGRAATAPVALLIEAGADLAARAMDGGTALHQAAWFGSPDNARQLIAAGAPIHLACILHNSTPLGWAVHGARYSGGADVKPERYIEIVRMLRAAGAGFRDEADRRRLLGDAIPTIAELLT